MGTGKGMRTSAPRGTRGYPKEGGRYTLGAGPVSQSAEVRDLSLRAVHAVTGRERKGSILELWSTCLTQSHCG